MSSARNEPDELLEQVLEDERAVALQEYYDREMAMDVPDLADA
jgi:hypothetical protein